MRGRGREDEKRERWEEERGESGEWGRAESEGNCGKDWFRSKLLAGNPTPIARQGHTNERTRSAFLSTV